MNQLSSEFSANIIYRANDECRRLLTRWGTRLGHHQSTDYFLFALPQRGAFAATLMERVKVPELNQPDPSCHGCRRWPISLHSATAPLVRCWPKRRNFLFEINNFGFGLD